SATMTIPRAWEDAVEALCVQLRTEEPEVGVELAEGLWLAIVIDLPAGIATVPLALLHEWDRPFEAVLALAQANLRREVEPALDARCAPLLLTAGEEYHAAATYLALGDLVDAPHGALVAFPTEHTATILPLGAMPGADALEMLVRGVEAEHEGADDPLSVEL